MGATFRLFPEVASTIASRIDGLYWFMIGMSAFFIGLIFCLLFVFAIRFRRRSEDERPPVMHVNRWLEVVWIVIPLGLTMVTFVWGASVYFSAMQPPEGAMEVYAVGKQWMWKFQHPEGRREINELHVPVGHPVKMTMTSQDVIHSFYVPAFRIKMDVLPGRYTHTWFEATKPGTYHLFCAEYCGTSHARMGGRVVALPPAQYETWLNTYQRGETMASAGERLFQQLGCESCHRAEGAVRAPLLTDLFGAMVSLENGQSIMADESYIRESILNPRAKIVAGYEAVMPAFQGQVSEEDLTQIVSYIKSLGTRQENGS